MNTLTSVIRQLDIRRAQVLIEAVIAEVRSDRAAEFGIQWRATTDPSEAGPFGGTNFTVTGRGINQLSADPLSVGSGLTLGFIDGTATILGQEFLNIAGLIRALASDAETNIVSTPTLVTLDNQEAEIVIAQNVPFITGQFTQTGAAEGAANPFQTIEREDVGLILRVKPQINEGNALQLDIEQEISNIVPTASPQGAAATGAVDLITQRRSIKTSVLVDDGRMLVLGGLLDDTLQESTEKVPLLGDLPLLGSLFRFDATTKTKRNLMVFLRPAILREANARAISNAKYNYLRAEQMNRRQEGVRLMLDEAEPLLPTVPEPKPGGQVTAPLVPEPKPVADPDAVSTDPYEWPDPVRDGG